MEAALISVAISLHNMSSIPLRLTAKGGDVYISRQEKKGAEVRRSCRRGQGVEVLGSSANRGGDLV